MSIDKVQLQQQEVVNNEVVLTDINPITSTGAVFDSSTGSTMQETLDRLWNAINSELARVVNSVNNRTGAVVLNSTDVGLGNVDNVSFNDIKNWVIDYFKTKMANFHYRLFDTLQEAVNLQQTNDASLDGVPFFAKVGLGADKLSYVGYYYWNEGTSELEINYKAINVVGEVDNSIIYNEVVGDKNYSGGRLGVNIHPDEDALYVENGLTKAQSGLRIHPDKFASKLIESPCLYGDVNATNAMLSANDASDDTPIRIFIDDVEVTTDHGHHLHKKWTEKLSKFNLVLTSFDSYYTLTIGFPPQLSGPNATFDLMDRQPAIGVVTHVSEDPTDPYIIQFYSIKSFVSGVGLKYVQNHGTGAHGSQLGIDFTHRMNADGVGLNNISGLTAQAHGLLPENATGAMSRSALAYRETFPYGYRSKSKYDEGLYNRGLMVTTDDSICRYPVSLFNPNGDTYIIDGEEYYYGSKVADNWSPLALYGFGVGSLLTGDITPDGPNNGFSGETSYLSVNLNKIIRDTAFKLTTNQPDDWDSNWKKYYTRELIENVDASNDYVYTKVTGSKPPWESGTYYEKDSLHHKYHFTDISGLRLTHRDTEFGHESGGDYGVLSEEHLKDLGIYDGKDSLGNDIDVTHYPVTNFSGGLSVNVGNFLEISPKEVGRGENYEDSGKVNVRIGKGLTDDVVFDEEIDLDVNIETNPPEGYYEHPEDFRLMNNDGKLIEIPIGMYPIGPDNPNLVNNWSTRYVDCYGREKYNTNPDRYIFFLLGKRYRLAPEYRDAEYYYNGPMNWLSLYGSIKLTMLYSGIYRITRSNRIAVDVDNKTIFIGSDNKLFANTSIDEFDPVNGSYRARQLVYAKLNGVNILFLTTSDFDVDGASSINYYITEGKLKYMSYIPDGTSIKMRNGFLRSITNIDIFESDTDYFKNQIIQGNTNKSLYRVLEDFNSGNKVIRYWLDNDRLSQITYDVDNKTLYTKNGSIQTKSTIIREWKENEFFYGREMITNESHTKVYMVIPEEGYTSSDSISTDVSGGKLLALN